MATLFIDHLEGFLMTMKPTYEELEQRANKLENKEMGSSVILERPNPSFLKGQWHGCYLNQF